MTLGQHYSSLIPLSSNHEYNSEYIFVILLKTQLFDLATSNVIFGLFIRTVSQKCQPFSTHDTTFPANWDTNIIAINLIGFWPTAEPNYKINGEINILPYCMIETGKNTSQCQLVILVDDIKCQLSIFRVKCFKSFVTVHVWADCMESRRLRVRTSLWPSSFEEKTVSSPLTRKDSILWGSIRDREVEKKQFLPHSLVKIQYCGGASVTER